MKNSVCPVLKKLSLMSLLLLPSFDNKTDVYVCNIPEACDVQILQDVCVCVHDFPVFLHSIFTYTFTFWVIAGTRCRPLVYMSTFIFQEESFLCATARALFCLHI